MIDYTQLSDNELLQEYQKEDRIQSTNKVIQMALKVTANSMYGALGSEHFSLYDTAMAEAITITGQLAVRWAEKYVNEHLNELLKTDNEDFVVAIDTDSLYVRMGKVVKKFLSEETDKHKIADFLNMVSDKKIQPILDQSFVDLTNYLHAHEPEALAMDREGIFDTGYWTAKKRYALNVLDMEGVRYREPHMKIMGMETAKSSTPGVVREYMEKVIYSTLNSTEKETQKLIRDFRKDFMKQSIEDISFPRGVNGLKKYRDFAQIYTKGTPIHVRGALLYNHYLFKWGLEKQYEEIREADKIKFVFLREPNTIHENIISYPVVFPRESGLTEFVDYEKMFQKAFKDPLQPIFDAIGWTMDKQNSVESFFV